MNKVAIVKTGIFVFAVFALFSSFPAIAEGGIVRCGGYGQPKCEICHLFQLIGIIANMIVWQIAPAIATIMIIFTGIKFFTALGNPGEIEKAKKMFFGIFAGFLVVVLAWSITVALYTAMGAGTPRGWWNIPGCPISPVSSAGRAGGS